MILKLSLSQKFSSSTDLLKPALTRMCARSDLAKVEVLIYDPGTIGSSGHPPVGMEEESERPSE
jgi:hypothetical protein